MSTPGSRVQCVVPQGPGTVLSASGGGWTCSISRPDDGEQEERVLPRYMRLPGAASPPAPPAASGEDEDEPPWIVSLRARAAASSERRVRTLRQLAASIQPLEDSLGTLGLSVRLVDEKSGLPITPG